VLEFSPVAKDGTTVLVRPADMTPEDVQPEIEAQLYGAITATEVVLPAMRETSSGTLMFTTGAGSVDPVPEVGNVNAAAAALRNWAINLNKELAGSGVYAVHIGINVSIDVSVIPGFPTAPAADIAAAYWELHNKRQDGEFIFSV
jgi:NAD(P)-dependent dehydrogenase (short-subunit alcohol dehydrogenase family)